MLLPEDATAAVDFESRPNRILSASPDAWRFLGWPWNDPKTGRTRILPAEYFGPIGQAGRPSPEFGHP